MKITVKQLRRIIKEEVQKVREVATPQHGLDSTTVIQAKIKRLLGIYGGGDYWGEYNPASKVVRNYLVTMDTVSNAEYSDIGYEGVIDIDEVEEELVNALINNGRKPIPEKDARPMAGKIMLDFGFA